MSTSCPGTGQASSWRDCRWAICPNSLRQGIGTACHLPLTPRCTFLDFSPNQWYHFVTVGLRWRQVLTLLCQPSGTTQPQTAVPLGHNLSLHNLEVLLGHTNCVNSKSKRTTNQEPLFSGEDFSSRHLVSRWGHTHVPSLLSLGGFVTYPAFDGLQLCV